MKIFDSSVSHLSVLLFLAALGLGVPQQSFAGHAGKMLTPRVAHTATLLEDARLAIPEEGRDLFRKRSFTIRPPARGPTPAA